VQPPEKISSTKRTTKTDVWHVGLLALQMYTGEGGEGKISRSSIPNIPSSISKSLRLFIRTCLQVDPLKRPNVSSLRLMDFFQVDPTKETNDMLKNVCDELDVSMRRLEREIVSPLRTNKLTTIASRLSYPHSTSNFRKKKKQATCDRLLLK
jgi:serine/threonine protein kinase